MKLPQSHPKYLNTKTPVQACFLLSEVVEFPLVSFNSFHCVVILTHKKNAYLENKFILRHVSTSKIYARIKVSITRLPQNYLRINFMVLGLVFGIFFFWNKLMLLISQKKTPSMKLWTKILQYLCIISRTEGVHYDTQPIKERVFCNNN